MDSYKGSKTNNEFYSKFFSDAFRSGTNASSSIGASTNPSASASTARLGSAGVEPGEDLNRKVDEYIQVAFAQVNVKLDELYKEKSTFIIQTERKVAKMLRESTAMMNSIESNLDTVRKLTDKSIETQGQLQDEVKSIKGNAVSALSIFVSFFAFITVSINVFSKAQNVASACGLVLIFWCLLIGFNILIGWQFNTLKHSGIAWFVLLVVVCISFFGLYGLYHFAPDLAAAQKAVM